MSIGRHDLSTCKPYCSVERRPFRRTASAEGLSPVIMDTGTTLPRRRSCDRCYAHKVRCIRMPKDNTKPTGDHNDSLPCLRCTRSGARCMYSPQRKSGRPPLLSQPISSSNPTAVKPFILDRRDSHSSMPPISALPISLANTDKDDFNLESVNFEALSSWLDDGNIPLHDDTADSGSIGEDQLSQYAAGDPEIEEGLLGGLSTTSEFSISPGEQFDGAVHRIDDNSYFNILNASISQGQNFRLTPNIPEKITEASSSPSDVEVTIRELTEISLRVCRSVESTCLPTATPLSVTSPVMNELFGATNSLICVIDRIIDQPRSSATKDLESDRRWLAQLAEREFDYSPLQELDAVPLEDGTALMVLSCHQQLLAAFDRIYSSLHGHLMTAQSPLVSRPRGHTSGPFDQETLASSFTAQAVMIVKLLKHLTSRLNRSLAPLAKSEKLPGNTDDGGCPSSLSCGSRIAWEEQVMGGESASSSSDSDTSATVVSLSTQNQTNANGAEKVSRGGFDSQCLSRYADMATLRLVCDAMKRRRIRLHGQIKGVKALTKSPSIS
ncbi:hypothetical protein F4818DRAFT_411318 [Hypoxylon cercidicola]|nr:hypothetical protein F4818DRAFT_411318 [Hypoxylon cercidicola]